MGNIEKIDLDRVDWKSSREFFESLGEALDKLEDKDESYNFTWVGKRKAIIEAGAPINKTLRPDIEASKDFDNTKNMLIVGDNLDALKLLQESYLGKIKMIYIDPPYNTGHDFVYRDNFTAKKDDYADSSTSNGGIKVIAEDEFTENSKVNGRFHSDWLSMIYPRLKLARNLLTDDGVIFISIDDNERTNCKKICDEIFGEDNFIADFVWKSKSGGANDSKLVAIDHEYILMYSKNISNVSTKLVGYTEELEGLYTSKDEYFEERGPYRPMLLQQKGLSFSKALTYEIEAPDGTKLVPEAGGAIWRWSKEKYEKGLKDGFIEFKLVNGQYKIYTKQYLYVDYDGNKIDRGKLIRSIIDDIDGRSGTRLLQTLFDGKKIFTNSKPKELIEKFAYISTDDNDIILDFFAGSGTTGHAVMDLNAEDGGNRKYICVQLDEKTDEKSEAKKAGYNTIDQITAERLRRAGDKIKSEHPEANIDTGFRVFRIDSSNENENLRKSLGNIEQTAMFDAIDNIKKDRTPLDLLFGVISHSALPLDLKLETRKINDNTIYLYGYFDESTGLVACFDDSVSDNTIQEIAKLKSLTAAFKDSTFEDSAAKINLSEHFRVLSPDTKVKVL